MSYGKPEQIERDAPYVSHTRSRASAKRIMKKYRNKRIRQRKRENIEDTTTVKEYYGYEY